jgi:hypothetical protein
MGLTCEPSNKVDLMVNLVTADGAGWIPTGAQILAIENYFVEINRAIADLTDGQMVLDTVALVANGEEPEAMIELKAGRCELGGQPCTDDNQCDGNRCDLAVAPPYASPEVPDPDPDPDVGPGGWGTTGRILVGTGCIRDPSCFGHQFMHFIGRVHDENEGREICDVGQPRFPGFCAGGTRDNELCENVGEEGVECPNDPLTPGNPGTCEPMRCILAPSAASDCVMQYPLDGNHWELCAAGNHEVNRRTEQHECTGGLSCWDQLAREWGSVIKAPNMLPEPDPGNPAAPFFFLAEGKPRIVAVIDRSGSMALENPSRIDVAVNVARDCIDFLSPGTEFGLVSFSDAEFGLPAGVAATKDFPEAAGLRSIEDTSDRGDAKLAIQGLLGRVFGNTHIGAGLLRALGIFSEVPPEKVTANSWVFLLTDGINNQPAENPQGVLNASLRELANDRPFREQGLLGLPVFATCIGQGRDSTQCANIADRTRGHFVDSAATSDIDEACFELVAKVERNGISQTMLDIPITQGQSAAPISVRIEPGVRQARFVISWTASTSNLDLQLFPPNATEPIDLGLREIGIQSEFYRIDSPEPGVWTMVVQGTAVPGSGEEFSAYALVHNEALNFGAGLARSLITWPEGFLVTAYPSFHGGVEGCDVQATVQKPDGTSEVITLHDEGETSDGNAHDGLYGALYRNFTPGDGIYTFLVRARCEQELAQTMEPRGPRSGPSRPAAPTFERTLRFSGIVTGVPDNLPPVAVICSDVLAECQGTAITLDGNCSYDPEGTELSYRWSSTTGTFADDSVAMPMASFPPGRHFVELQVMDAEGVLSEPDVGRVILFDRAGPVIESVTATPDELWSPDHGMVPVTLTAHVADTCDTAPICEISSVTSNESDNGNGDGNTEPDWEITGPLSLNLRGERAGGGYGRGYTIEVICSDASGYESSATTTVTVPHDQGP